MRFSTFPLKRLPSRPAPQTPVHTAEIGIGALSPSGPPPSSPFLSPATPTSSLAPRMTYLVLSPKLHLHGVPPYSTLFPPLLPSFASFFKAQLNASSSRKPSWICPRGSPSGLNSHHTRAEPPPAARPLGLCPGGHRMVRKGLCPHFLHLFCHLIVKLLTDRNFCLARSLLYSQYPGQCLPSNK